MKMVLFVTGAIACMIAVACVGDAPASSAAPAADAGGACSIDGTYVVTETPGTTTCPPGTITNGTDKLTFVTAADQSVTVAFASASTVACMGGQVTGCSLTDTCPIQYQNATITHVIAITFAGTAVTGVDNAVIQFTAGPNNGMSCTGTINFSGQKE